MIFGECDNSSLTHIGKHKNLILFVRWRHKGYVIYLVVVYNNLLVTLVTQKIVVDRALYHICFRFRCKQRMCFYHRDFMQFLD